MILLSRGGGLGTEGGIIIKEENQNKYGVKGYKKGKE